MFFTIVLSYNSPKSALQGGFCVMESRRMSRGQFLRNFEKSKIFDFFDFFNFSLLRLFSDLIHVPLQSPGGEVENESRIGF